MIVSALGIFLWFSGVKVKTDLYQIFEMLLYSYFGLDHASNFEIIHTGIDNRQFVWYYLYVRSQM